ncbi:hypothetical protein F5I97DRAFT_1854283 [Phlebopus sp. FC_14]|nr:hypothetical protein F5I97DRAFT_1854283 [Phlebopus sp. FC_14]
MAPAITPVRKSSPSNRSIRYLHRRIFAFSQHAQKRQSASTTGDSYPPNSAAQPPEGPELGPPLSTDPVVPFISEQLTPVPTGNSQPPRTLQSDDIPGNVTAAVIVAVVLVGGLIGLVIGGEMLRRRSKQPREVKSQQASGWCGRRKSRSPLQIPSIRIDPSRAKSEEFAYDEKTLTPLDAAPVASRRDRRGRLSDVWPLRALLLRGSPSAAKSPSVQPRTPHPQRAPVPPPLPQTQTTWSEFSPGLLSGAHSTPKHFLARIPEELEDDCESQTGSEIAMSLGIALQRSLDSGSVLSFTPAVRSKSLFSMHSGCFTIG